MRARTAGTPGTDVIRRLRGSALIDALLSLSIIATLAVTGSQIQLTQRRLQDALAQRLSASALLDAWAEQRQMSASAHGDEAPAMRQRAWDSATAAAASRLPNGRAYQRHVGGALVELEIRWRPTIVATRSERHLSSLASRNPDQSPDGERELFCESLLVASSP